MVQILGDIHRFQVIMECQQAVRESVVRMNFPLMVTH